MGKENVFSNLYNKDNERSLNMNNTIESSMLIVN